VCGSVTVSYTMGMGNPFKQKASLQRASSKLSRDTLFIIQEDFANLCCYTALARLNLSRTLCIGIATLSVMASTRPRWQCQEGNT